MSETPGRSDEAALSDEFIARVREELAEMLERRLWTENPDTENA